MVSADLTKGLNILENVRVSLGEGEGGEKFYKIMNRDTLFHRDEHNSLAAGGTESYTEITQLNPPTGQIYQITGIEISGNVEIYLKQPAATNRWGTQRSPEGGPLSDNMSPKHSPQYLNVWVLKDYPPNIQIKNNTNVAIVPVLYWIGWRYLVQELREKPTVFQPITVAGIK